ncbi:WXG100 family type VII secretion target [Nocardia sp. NPDC057227]|uniref:WXG100 family type VII secretion target n=1 Tax=Nocardia sp. NPDC057227 TaxID=3346056 RepID=UPI00362AC7CA
MAAHSFDLDALAAFSGTLNGFLRSLSTEMGSVTAAISALDSGFTGQTADAVATAHRMWQAEGAEIIAQLADYRTKLDNAHHNYSAARRAIADTLNSSAAGG